MATLEKIRSKGVLLLIVVGAAMVIFIVGDFVNSGSTLIQESNANVAIINGEKVKINDYSQTLEQFNTVVEMEYGSNINSDMSEQIRNMVWESTLRENVITSECEEIGMTVTTNELSDMLVGNNISPILSGNRMFTNENGQFDVNAVKQFLTTIDSEEIQEQMSAEEINKYKTYWRYWEQAVKNDRLDSKYRNLLAKSMVSNPLEAEYAYNNNKTTADVVYTMKNYMTIADSTITVSDKEIKNLYNNKKNQFKQELTADINYIALPIRPSKEDYMEVETWINSIKSDFATNSDVTDFTNANSEIAYRGENLTKEQIDEDFKEFAFSASKDSVLGPIFSNDTYKMARIVESGIMLPDSVKISHIYIRSETAEKTQALADSLQAAITNGADFALLASQHSLAESGKNGGEIGWISEMGLDKKIATPAFSTPVHGMFQVKEGNDINLFYINEVKENVSKVKLAIVSRHVDASSETRTQLYNQAKQYVVENNTEENFMANAGTAGLILSEASKINVNASALNDIKNSREVIRWVFENEKGSVSDVFEVENNIIIATINKINPKGYTPLEEVREQLLSEIRRDKKGEIIVNDINGKQMSDLVAQGFIQDTVRNVNFASNYAGSIGNEPKLFAQVATAELNQESAPIVGNTGVYIFKVINKVDSEKEYNEKEEMMMLSARENYSIQYLYFEALKRAAEVEDLRYKYY